MTQHIITINGGSSSIKFALYILDGAPKPLLNGAITGIGSTASTWSVSDSPVSAPVSQTLTPIDYPAAIAMLATWLQQRCANMTILAIGHRVVHGGPLYFEAETITPLLLDKLQEFSALDPEHLPYSLLLINALQHALPTIPHVACFDTAFHHDLPRVASILAIPRRLEAQGIRKYGFHGLSYAFLMEELARLAGHDVANKRVILAHLGSGASLAAVYQGKCVDTSMSFSPCAGIPMSTRSGDLDPSLMHYLSQTAGLTPEQFHAMVHFQSGLLGISETSADIRTLLALEDSDVRAKEAIEVFCYHIKKWIGSFTAILGGLDVLIFSGGIGEHQHAIRARITAGLAFLGLTLDEQANQDNAQIISSAQSHVMVRVIKTDEQAMIARLVNNKLKGTKSS